MIRYVLPVSWMTSDRVVRVQSSSSLIHSTLAYFLFNQDGPIPEIHQNKTVGRILLAGFLQAEYLPLPNQQCQSIEVTDR